MIHKYLLLTNVIMLKDGEKKLLFHYNEETNSSTHIIFFDKGIEIIGDGYDRGRLKNLSETVTYCIMDEELNKLIKIIEKENPNLDSIIDIERCKNRIGEEKRDNLEKKEKRIYSIFDAMFYELDAYAVIFDYIKEKGIHYDFYGADVI